MQKVECPARRGRKPALPANGTFCVQMPAAAIAVLAGESDLSPEIATEPPA